MAEKNESAGEKILKIVIAVIFIPGGVIYGGWELYRYLKRKKPKKPKILIIDDSETAQDKFVKELAGKATILSAFTVEQAEKFFAANSDIDVIAIDACVPGVEPTTTPLVRELRRTFKGLMIAISGFRGYRQDLVEAGCDFGCVKEELCGKFLEFLKI